MNFIKKEALAQVFSCEFCESSKDNFFTEHLWRTTSECKVVIRKLHSALAKEYINKIDVQSLVVD